MSLKRSFVPVLALALTSSAGCELFSAIDRSKIPDGFSTWVSASGGGTGGANTGGTGGTSTGGTGGTSTGGTGGVSTGGSGGSGGAMTGGSGGAMTGGSGGAMTGGSGGTSTTSTSSTSSTTTNTGGAGGASTGGAGGMATGGADGGMPECQTAAQCPTPANECLAAACVDGACTTTFVPDDVPGKNQTVGDCRRKACDGNGNLVDKVDDSDTPDDGNGCTVDTCLNGEKVFTNEASGAPCGSALVCDGAGTCVGCTQPSHCGLDTPCRTFTCTAGVCGHVDKALGFEVSNGVPGDCRTDQCDGNGNLTINAAEDDDQPVDGKACTSDVCQSGAPSNPPVPIGAPCSEGGGSLCDGAGKCVACLQPSDCGATTPCKSFTCNSGQCVAVNAPPGTLAANPALGDCRTDRCDGSGNVIANAADGTDKPIDGKQCTSDVCSNGSPSNPPLAANTPCTENGGHRCDAFGNCVACVVDAECGANTACKTFTCTSAGQCQQTNAASGTLVSNVIVGDCHTSRCDSAGNVIGSVIDDSDAPADDGLQCTLDTCTNGVVGHPAAPAGTTCNQNGGSTCDGAGACVTCTADSQCPTGNACQIAKCITGACGFIAAPAAALPPSAQTAGDCQRRECDGATQAPVSVADNSDVPADDGFECTTDTCVAGVVTHPPRTAGTPCSEDGGLMCDEGGLCVTCLVDGDCAAGLNECQTARCLAGGECDWDPVPAGTATAAQSSGDCQEQQCDGDGGFQSAALDTDLPDDGLDCTTDTCDAGEMVFTAAPEGTACAQNGGLACDALGVCQAPPTVAATMPGDGTTDLPWDGVSVIFDQLMDPTTLVVQDTPGPCTGSIQVSLDDFATCVGFWSTSPDMWPDNATATMWPRPGLLVNRTYKVRVLDTVESALGYAMAADYTSSAGFTVESPNTCDESVVISKVYGGGGTPGAPYKFDFVELHNRGSWAVDLSEMSLQYSAPTSYQWTQDPVTFPADTILEPGAYYLVQLATGGPAGAPLPTTPDLVSNQINLSGVAGKIALVWSTWQQPFDPCPDPWDVVDFVSYGTTNCSEGSQWGDTTAPALDATKVAVRNGAEGCIDLDSNELDFTAVAVAAQTLRNTATAPAICACGAVNESGAADEADYCTTQFPLSLESPVWDPTEVIYGRIYEQGVTEAAGAPPGVIAQVGYGEIDSNPQWEWGWRWTNATYNVQSGNNDEFQASITPYWNDTGTYRYVYRFSLDGGLRWTYCDNAQGDMGAGSDTGLTFDFADEGVVTFTN